MKWIFWISVALVCYTYAGYPLLLWLLAKLRPRAVSKQPIEPSVSIVLAVHNEARRLITKLQNLRELDYPADRVQIIVVSDGSTDETNELLGKLECIVPVIQARNAGKAAALNAGLAVAAGEVVVFMDVRQEIERSALRRLVANFADESVGCVSGELLFHKAGEATESGVSVYWRIEKVIRRLEAATGSVVGATGAIYAARRTLVPVVPEGTLLDDVYIPLAVARAEYRVVFESEARAWDEEPQAGKHEFRRKVRTLAGNYQLLQLAPWLLTAKNPLRFRLWSHKLLRLVVPFLLISAMLTSCLLWSYSLYRGLAILQIVFYVLAVVGLTLGRRVPLASAPASFCLLNAAAAAALLKFVHHRNSPTLLWKGNVSGHSVESPSLSSTQFAGKAGTGEPV